MRVGPISFAYALKRSVGPLEIVNGIRDDLTAVEVAEM